ncbi:MAG: hypothetical protein V3S16_14785 [Candidatus Desulfatibia sp.]
MSKCSCKSSDKSADKTEGCAQNSAKECHGHGKDHACGKKRNS